MSVAVAGSGFGVLRGRRLPWGQQWWWIVEGDRSKDSRGKWVAAVAWLFAVCTMMDSGAGGGMGMWPLGVVAW